MKDNGLLVVISGPAGAGKGTVVKELVKNDNIKVSVSATTRSPRRSRAAVVRKALHSCIAWGRGVVWAISTAEASM